MKLRILIFLVIFFIVTQIAFSLGIGSTQTTITLHRGDSKILQFYIINDEQKDINVSLTISGLLKDYIFPEDTRFSLKTTDKIVPFKVYAVIPEDFYGSGKTRIMVSEERQETGQITAMVVASFIINYNEQQETTTGEATGGTSSGGGSQARTEKKLISFPETFSSAEENTTEEEAIEKTKKEEKKIFIQKPKQETKTRQKIISLIVISLATIVLIAFILYLKQVKSYSGDSILKVENFVKRSLEKGEREEEIKEKLKSVGWPERIIEDILRKHRK